MAKAADGAFEAIAGKNPHAFTASQGLAQRIKAEARRLGFSACRVAPIGEASQADFFDMWVAAGRSGEMTWLGRNGDKRRFPALLAAESEPAFQSIILLATPYHPHDLPQAVRDDPARGIIASYAWGEDYHDLIRGRLHALDSAIAAASGRTSHGKALVDSGPVLERNWAQEAGIGFTGKNCCTIRPGEGSWLFLATLLVPESILPDLAPSHNLRASAPLVLEGLPPEEVFGTWRVEDLPRSGGCGRCTRCLDACPTGAFVGPYHLDPQRCISDRTIEARGAIPRELRRSFGNRIFGCDICQEVCPWNSRTTRPIEVDLRFSAALDRAAPPLLEGFASEHPYWLNDTAFAERFRKSPVMRARRSGMLRNVCVALGNWGDPAAAPALGAALLDADPIARAHAAWATGELLRRHDLSELHACLVAALEAEGDSDVRAEMSLALGNTVN